MPNWTGKTIAELRVMDAAEIRAALAAFFAPLSKKELIEFDQDATEFTDKPQVTSGEHGIVSRAQTVRDALGDVLRVEATEKSYYPGGEIDEIIQVKTNADGDEIDDSVIKHRIGSQPEGKFVLTVVLAPRDTSDITAPWHGEYWKLVDTGNQASLWAVDAPASVLLDLHDELWAMSPAGTFGVLAVASARPNVFLPAAVRYHVGISEVEALARRDRIADYLDGLGKDTTELRAALDEHVQMVAIVGALGFSVTQFWSAMRR